MIYAKSALVGLLTLMAAFIVLPILGMIAYSIISPPPPGSGVGWDPVSAVKYPPYWIAALVIFAAGFFWEFRRRSHR